MGSYPVQLPISWECSYYYGDENLHITLGHLRTPDFAVRVCAKSTMAYATTVEHPRDLETPPEERDHAENPDRSGPSMAEGGGEAKGEESERQRIERLGRERPEKFKSLGAEIFFCYSVIASQFMAVSLLCAEGFDDPAAQC